MNDWFNHSFGEDYLIVYKHRDMEKAKNEVQAMASWLDLPKNANILDLCCGMGRHAMALEELGHRVTGFDLSHALLRVAKQHDVQNKVTWIQGDMRDVSFQDSFDAVFNLFTSFGYFVSDEENMQVLTQIRKSLVADGVWLMDYLNPHYVETHLIPKSDREQDGYFITETREIRDGFVQKQIEIVHPSGELKTYAEKVKLYDLAWFKQAFSDVGLQLTNVYGNYDQSPFSSDSPRMIMMGKVNV